jgi:hypothetical protein
MVKALAGGGAELTVQTRTRETVRVTLLDDELAALKEVLS